MPESLSRQRTRIVATLGPASEEPVLVEHLVRAGMDVARLNLSHGEHGEHEARLRAVRAASRVTGIPVAVMADLQGPKIRLGSFGGDGTARWEPGATVTITTAPCPAGDAHRVGCTYDALHEDLATGYRILVDDGLVRLDVEEVCGREIRCRVVVGGTVSSHKGMNLPGARITAPVLSAKDRADLAWALAAGVDLVALSFVRSAADVTALRAACGDAHPLPGIVAKIERAEAVEDIDAILAVADGIMVARGDLGTEIGYHHLPGVQKALLRLAAETGRLAITATQMLESMVRQAVPTRAEVSDVANAVYDGSDAVMLSAETAIGVYPARAVAQMAAICREAEDGRWQRRYDVDPDRCDLPRRDLALSRAAVMLATELHADVILVSCGDGIDLRLLPALGKLRSPVPIRACCRTRRVWHRLATVWGVTPQFVGDAGGTGGAGTCDPDAPADAIFLAPDETAVVLEGLGVKGPTALAVRRGDEPG